MPWHPIPGFGNYEVNDDLRVRVACNARILLLDWNHVRLSRQGVKHYFHPEALLKGALSGIEPIASRVRVKHNSNKLADERVEDAKRASRAATPNTEALLAGWAGNPLLAGLDARECWVGF